MTKTKKSNGHKPSLRVIAILCATAIFIACSLGVYAWLVLGNRQIKNQVAITDFSVSGSIYFEQGTGMDNLLSLEELKSKTPISPSDGSLIVTSLQPGNTNYIANLRVVANFTSQASPAYIRVRILEQWTANDVFIPSIMTPYTVADNKEGNRIFPDDFSGANILKKLFPSWGQKNNLNTTDSSALWYDNRKNDSSYYYTVPVYADSEADELRMLLINGITEENIKKMQNMAGTASLQLVIEVEAAQPNRFRELFRADEYPWVSNP